MDHFAASQPKFFQFETRTFGDVKCIRGDCLSVMLTMDPNSIDFVFGDIPYGVTGCTWDIFLPLADFWDKVNVLKRSPKSVTILMCTFKPSMVVAQSNTKELRYDLIWARKRATGFMRAKLAPLTHHEHILIFFKKQGTYNPQMVAGKKNTTTTKQQKGSIFNNPKAALDKHKSSFRYPQSTLSVDESDLRYDHLNGRKGGRLHPTQKPIALLEWLIRTYTNDGDTILDPVAGSGTTAVAAMNVGGGRKVICIEKDPTYFEVMCKRIAEHQQKMEAARE